MEKDSLACLDLATYGKPIVIYGSLESDESQRLELRLTPCDEDNPACRVSQFRDET